MNPRTPHTHRTPRTTATARRSAVALTAVLSALSLSACGVLGGAGDDAPAASARNDITVGLLLPDRDTERFEKFDRPLIEERVLELTDRQGEVAHANAGGSAEKQSEQFGELVADGVDVILVDAVDAGAIAPAVEKAEDAGIPVIAYDRLAEGPVDAYVSHDNELVGELQGRALVSALGAGAEGSKVVMMNGEPTDPNTALFKKGALGELDGRVDIAASYDTRKWLPRVAEENMRKAIRAVGADDIAAVYAANDGVAGAVIEAMEEAGVTDIPPVTGQDADLAAVRRIVSGEQHMTVYKSFLLEAQGAADMAVARARGRDITFDALTRDRVDSRTRRDIPAMLVPVVALTADNIEDTVVRDGVHTVEDICTAAYAAACAEIGLTP
ncbi:sugar ABC transporter substrate-binding protein [Streptomyces griseomycini]|uniref:D-xylose transport system substrate-binding protein n=1 Tax=Streptomyces griseomycini TaxID=66895 RepID=A0A7W7LXW5_9ACTN|nr:D-xylose transport system substrate-binding protein [Streptomyces griseomycini]GGQ08513.1 solute-binding protein [Streptomyces griseomycini]GGR31956.1 solute-binding protein [Streptomyces griseomycini]